MTLLTILTFPFFVATLSFRMVYSDTRVDPPLDLATVCVVFRFALTSCTTRADTDAAPTPLRRRSGVPFRGEGQSHHDIIPWQLLSLPGHSCILCRRSDALELHACRVRDASFGPHRRIVCTAPPNGAPVSVEDISSAPASLFPAKALVSPPTASVSPASVPDPPCARHGYPCSFGHTHQQHASSDNSLSYNAEGLSADDDSLELWRPARGRMQ
ncbi:hypothetical protein R3P38DRAFT_501545 [Favolaschia claudopus]|uniref:Secreted protein n=1 Tax=Favolaschia claudopus TaxID=2862362 RepID=A0AAV9ZCB7_9AGAR